MVVAAILARVIVLGWVDARIDAGRMAGVASFYT